MVLCYDKDVDGNAAAAAAAAAADDDDDDDDDDENNVDDDHDDHDDYDDDDDDGDDDDDDDDDYDDENDENNDVGEDLVPPHCLADSTSSSTASLNTLREESRLFLLKDPVADIILENIEGIRGPNKQPVARVRQDKAKDVVIQHDNARPHTSRQTQCALQQLELPTISHPTYSPDLAPSDFFLFPLLKKHLKGNHYETDAEIEADVRSWCRSQTPKFFADGMRKLVQRWRLCIERDGDYVEK
ncbi:hypothetical protein EGW08_006293 [Elysia chlorotica]|uniref:Tc1-like transposase DDE domain-containing protein n=1 Tax=Elysia chlorotica TaxID=188477 RepID=A0A3S1BKM5_ELYCH|nr:hypothetical protein EGW08_006293 [Elysia chlorotica]